MGAIQILSESDLRSAVGIAPDELLTIEAVFPLISSGRAHLPPILRIDVPEHRGEIDVKSAYLPGYDRIAVKVSSGFFDNPAIGLPSLGGLLVLLDTRTGLPRATLFDNGYLTDLRTALAGAVAAKHLAVTDARVVAVLGAGVQARLQVAALPLVRPIERVVVWARDADRAAAFASELSPQLDLEIVTAPSPSEAARDADVLVTTTPATEPIVDLAALHPGLHITAVGSDAEHKQELAATVLQTADLVVCDHRGQSSRLGELRTAIASGFAAADAVELGEIVAGRRPGRTSRESVTVCDLTGTGAQDTAIATLALARCLEAGAGFAIAT